MPRQARPRIGINADLAPASKSSAAALRLALGYVDAVAVAGGLPLVVPPVARAPELDDYLDVLDAFVLTGSSLDLDPRKNGTQAHPSVQPVPSRRDDSDRALVQKLISRRMPLLAIGLGMQQVNVALGGTLFAHLPDDLPRGLPHRDPSGGPHRHAARVASGTRLERIFGPDELLVNSHHHQAVNRVGKGLRVAATAPDGVVEAIEAVEEWFCVGVQWHPESETATAFDLQLFQSLVEACAPPAAARRAA